MALATTPARTKNEIEPEIEAARREMERRLTEDRAAHERLLAEENCAYFTLVAAAGLQAGWHTRTVQYHIGRYSSLVHSLLCGYSFVGLLFYMFAQLLL